MYHHTAGIRETETERQTGIDMLREKEIQKGCNMDIQGEIKKQEDIKIHDSS